MLDLIILAGGKGKRMGSDLPKPLFEVNGRPAILRIIDAAAPLSRKPIIVIGPHSMSIKDATANKYEYVLQEVTRGTGHAVLTVKNALRDRPSAPTTMVILGDHPLVSTTTLKGLFAAHRADNADAKSTAPITITTVTVPDFEGDRRCFYSYGRIKRNADGAVTGNVELKDTNDDEKNIKELNVSYYCFDTQWLWDNIHRLTDDNAAHEFYLTDMIRQAALQGRRINTYAITDPREAMGFNTPEELEALRRLDKPTPLRYT